MMIKNRIRLNLVSRIFLVLVLSSVVLTSCMSIKPGTEKSAKKLYETFFVGEEGTQYFIKPLSLESTDKNSSVNIDFTFRYKTTDTTVVTVNFEIFDKELIKTIDRFKIQCADKTIECIDNKLLFNERKKNAYVSRYSTTIKLSDLKSIMKNGDWTVSLFENKKSRTYISTRKTKSSIYKLNNDLFVLF